MAGKVAGDGVQKLGVKLSVEVCFAFNIPTLLLRATHVNRVSLHAHVEIDLPQPSHWGFRRGSAGKESACNAGDLGWTPGLGRSGEGNGYPLQYSGQENSKSMGSQRTDTTERLPLSLSTFPLGLP